MIHPVVCSDKVIVVAENWPCWLGCLLAVNTPVQAAFVTMEMASIFPGYSHWLSKISDFEAMSVVPDEWQDYVILGSGSHEFLRLIMPKLRHHAGPFIFANDMIFTGRRQYDLDRLYRSWTTHDVTLGLDSVVVRHAEFGGVTSAFHVVSFRGVNRSVFTPTAPLPRTLRHVLCDTSSSPLQEIAIPSPLYDPQPRSPIYVDGLMRREGLFDVSRPTDHIACPSVFKASGWGRRGLSTTEMLRAFDISPLMDSMLLPHRRARTLLQRSITPLVVTSICRNLWSTRGGRRGASADQGSANGILPSDTGSMDEDKADCEGNEFIQREDDGTKESSRKEDISQKEDYGGNGGSEEDGRKAACSDGARTSQEQAGLAQERELFKAIKKAHDLAKAVKSDDAEVPKHLWDAAVCRGPPSPEQAKALSILRLFMMRVYRQRLGREIRSYMNYNHGSNWLDKMRNPTMNRNTAEEAEGMRDILWRASENEWFQCPIGSRLLFFRFPRRYRTQALRGVRIMFTDKGPSSRRQQPPLKPDEKQVLRKKVKKFLERKYVAPYQGRISSLIKYFAVPKGIIDGEVQDWRTVFHAGANKLNDVVWVPSFGLPTVNSLLRITDVLSLMEDRDVEEMFLNFQLHSDAMKYTGIDIGPLEFTLDECTSRWVCWNRNLMGFRPSPYNSIRMFLIAEEVIRGDRHDPSNPLQWNCILLNLPGTREYNPSIAWISKRRTDGSLASDFVTFVDDLRLTAQGPERVKELGHTVSTKQAYLGIQDALRKLRAAGGTKRPGAWAGSSVCVEDDKGLVVLTSQEKWDRLKTICRHWLECITRGETMLDFKRLRSDRGFLVYVTQVYPAMKPYLKGFHLSLESWRGGRDAEGWKARASKIKVKPSEEVSQAQAEEEAFLDDGLGKMEDIKEELLRHMLVGGVDSGRTDGPPSGFTEAVPRFREDLEALLHLAQSDEPVMRCVRNKHTITAYYGFGDASSGGFGSTVERPDGLHGRFGIWGSDNEDKSSNYRELCNLVETIEEEAKEGHLKDGELWIFTDNSTAESCFFRGGSTSKTLHELVLRLRKVEMSYSVTLHLVHVAGTRMIAQGTDGLSRGSFLEGVARGEHMLSFVNLAQNALDRHPALLRFLQSWIEPVVGKFKMLSTEEWFQEGHGIIGGEKDHNGVWIPKHAPNGKAYVWTPPPVIADVALEECMKAIHKRTDAYHIFLIPRLYSPLWLRMLYKVSDVVVKIPPGSRYWPSNLHEPLFMGISLPLLTRSPWTLRGTPLLVGLERQLHQVLRSGEEDGRDLLRKLLRTPRQLASMSESMARKLLRLPGTGEVSTEEDSGRGRQPMVHA